MGWIYKFKFPNGKCYVGQTKHKNVRKRWNQHKNEKRTKDHCRILHRAIIKYGWGNIVKKKLFVDNKDLDEKEKYFIAKYKSFKKGYNLTPGGEINPMKVAAVRQKLSKTCSTDEHKKAVSKKIKSLHSDPDWKEKWLEKNRDSHRTDEARFEQGERSKEVWKKEKAAGKDRGVAIRAALNDPEYKKKRDAKRNTPEGKAIEAARIAKIKATYAKKKLLTGSQ